jgi:hypothetical protein
LSGCSIGRAVRTIVLGICSPEASVKPVWTFEDFDQCDAIRAAHLRRSPPWLELVRETCSALRSALRNGNARFGLEESSRDLSELRAVVQFPLGRDLFDWLFNGQSGYRAQFRIGAENGLIQNSRLISSLSAQLSLSGLHEITASRLTSAFEYKEPFVCTIDRVIASLDPKLSKVWACERLINPVGGVQNLFVSRTGPRRCSWMVGYEGCIHWLCWRVSDQVTGGARCHS